MSFSQYEFIEIYDTYHTALYRYILVRCSQVAVAQDLTSETFYRVWNYCSRHPDKRPKNMRAYLYTVGSNVVADYFKKNRPIFSLDDEQAQQLVQNVARTESYHSRERAGEFTHIYKALRKLPMEYSEIIILRYIQDLPYADIAVIMDKSEGALRVLHSRAMKELRSLLRT